MVLLLPGLFRRSGAAALFSVASILGGAVLVSSTPAAGDGLTSPAPLMEGPFTVTPYASPPSGAAFVFTFTRGQSATCGANIAGEGWECPIQHRPHKVEFNGRVPNDSSFGGSPVYDSLTVQLFVLPHGAPGPLLVQEKSAPCNGSGDWCAAAAKTYPASNYWTEWYGVEGGQLFGRLLLRHHDFFTGVASTWDTGTFGLSFEIPRVRRAEELKNTPPEVTGFSPVEMNGLVESPVPIHRSSPVHMQRFAIHVRDEDAHNLTARLDIFAPYRTPCVGIGDTYYEWDLPQKSNPKPSPPLAGFWVGSHPAGLTTPPLPLPSMNGTFTACVRTRDTSGSSNAEGELQTFTFDFVWNLAPISGEQTVPSPDGSTTFHAGVPVALVARATDLENDPLTVETRIAGKEYRSVPTASGREAVTLIGEGLDANFEQFAEVRGRDVYDAAGDYGGRVFFDVVESPATNDAPRQPTLVAPFNGGQFASDATQEFVVRVTDPESNRYRAVVEVSDVGGSLVAAFATEEAVSGETVSARPLTPLPSGSYRWRARAFDQQGSLGPWSISQSFSVQAASSTDFVSDDCASGTTLVQLAAGGHYVHVQMSGRDTCWRIDGPTVAAGGKVTVTDPNSSVPPVAAVDDNTAVCTKLFDGGIADPSRPGGELRISLGTAATTGSASVCVQLGEQRHRVEQRFPSSGGTPAVVAAFDPPGRSSGTITPQPGLPSSSCSGQSTSTTHSATRSGVAFSHVTSWQETPTRLHLCARYESVGTGGPSVGGRLTLDSTGSSGITPVASIGFDAVGCGPKLVFTEAPVIMELRASTANPASVCLVLSGITVRAAAGATGASSPPTAIWSPDPGTPDF